MHTLLIQASLLLVVAIGPAIGANPQLSKSSSVQYRLELLKPNNDETFIDTGNIVTVQLRLEPELQAGHSIWIFLDGNRVDGLPTTGDTFNLTNVWRGTHTVHATVMDDDNKPLLGSQPVTFHMRQTSVVSPAGTNLNAPITAADKARCVAAAKAKGRQPTHAEVKGYCDANGKDSKPDAKPGDPAKCVAAARAAGRQPTFAVVNGHCK